MSLNNLSRPVYVKSRKRVGRGIGSTKGKTAGKGHKGQKARAGASIKGEGGQTTLIRRLPKVGFTSRKKIRSNVHVCTLRTISELIKSGRILETDVIDDNLFRNKGIIAKHKVLKIIGNDLLNSPIKTSVKKISAGARKAIESSGGEIL
ncbi:50S ribosomal protein L15 [Candidatus Nesciobacter abundans]|uniref:Large ribosomal subunit protein uL15 n=1 Tax=Candidatus Nesciobacter abundans TaxID=2601668 RepID=A0A5C0UGI0_9PROT|nr:50S ribosomal protein L15 [Candidatus Nesciobacter abundans]QEK38919.1 50S ribosomal protein L15 [Candidatus Nesciobacter abundans]